MIDIHAFWIMMILIFCVAKKGALILNYNISKKMDNNENIISYNNWKKFQNILRIKYFY